MKFRALVRVLTEAVLVARVNTGVSCESLTSRQRNASIFDFRTL
jgi:hypothetical protein